MRVAIFTRFNDNKNIIEFMKYHYSIGIDKIFIYNDGLCNIERICQKYFPKTKENNYTYPFDIFYYNWIDKNDIVTLNTSIRFYELVINRVKNYNDKFGSIDYLVHIDTDEYITLKKFNNVHELINHYKPFDQLYLNWVFFGDSNIYKVVYNDSNKKEHRNGKWLHLEPILHINRLSDDRISSNDIKSIVNLKTCISARNPHYFTKFTVSDPIIKDVFNNIQPLSPTIQLKGPDGSIWKNDSLDELPCYLSHFICITCHDFFYRRFHYKHGYRTSRLVEEYKGKDVKDFLKYNLNFIIKCSLLGLLLEQIKLHIHGPLELVSRNYNALELVDKNYNALELVDRNYNNALELVSGNYNNALELAQLVYKISSFYNSHNKNIITNEHFSNFVKNNSDMYNIKTKIIMIKKDI